MTRHDDDSERFTWGERCRGVLELSIILGVIVWTLVFPSLVMLPVLAIAGGVLVALAVWDDVACRSAQAARVRRSSASARKSRDAGRGTSGRPPRGLTRV